MQHPLRRGADCNAIDVKTGAIPARILHVRLKTNSQRANHREPSVTTLPSVGAQSRQPQIDEDRVAHEQGSAQARLPRQPVLHPGQVSGAGHARPTTTWRWPTRCATACCSAGSAPRRRTPSRARARWRISRPSSSWARTSATTSSISASTTTARTAVAELGLDLEELLAQEDEPGPGQRRPRPPRGLLHRLAGHARDSGAGLRHPLRVRHLPAGDRRRLAGGEDRQVAALRQSLGDRAARVVRAR